MSPPNPPYRSFTETEKAAQQLRGFHEAWPRFEGAWIGYSWRLINGPHQGYMIDEGGEVYLMKFPSWERFVEIPEFSVLYKFDDQFVHILSMRFVSETSKTE